MSKHNLSTFQLEGQFLRFELEDGYKVKYLWLRTTTGETCIKLSKQARASLVSQALSLQPGDWIRLLGEQEFKPKTETLKQKALYITRIDPCALTPATAPTKEATAPLKPACKGQATILVCQKSDCMKKGGKAVCAALEKTLRDRGLEDQISIKGTGCMKHCKAGPNLVVMPDKTRYSRISAEQIPELIEKHFAALVPAPIAPSLQTTVEAIAPEATLPVFTSLAEVILMS